MSVIRLLVALVFLAVVASLAAGEEQAVEFRIADSHPGLSGRLGAGEQLYLNLAYKSSRPLRFRAEGHAGGQQVSAGATTNIAPPYPAGEGEALVWIAYRQPVTLDEIRIAALDEKWKPLASIKAPARLEWGAAAGRRPRPEWAERLNREQQEMGRLQSQKASEGYALIGGVMITISMFSILGYLVLQPLLAWKYTGRWRIAALVPLLAVVPLFGQALYALKADSNLWPIGLIFFMPLAFLFLLLVAGARWLAARQARP